MEGSVFGRWLNNLKRDQITPELNELKKKGMQWNGWHAFRRGLATNLPDMGVPTKVIQRMCRHTDEATTKRKCVTLCVTTERAVAKSSLSDDKPNTPNISCARTA